MLKKLKYYLFYVILGLCININLKAQVYPVQINTQLIPPYSLRLSDYVAPGTSRIATNILLTDINEPQYNIRLELFIEGDGITIKTSPSHNPGPIILQGGVPEYLTSSDLAEYFEPRNLEFSGYSKSDYLVNGRLPEGVYRFSFRAYDYNKGVRVSNNTPVTAWLLLNDPPIINLPFPDHKVEHIDPQNIVFQWMPRHTASPNSAFTTEYEFTLVEIWPEGRDPNNAIQTSIPIYQETTTSTALVYGLSEPFLEPGRKYAYQVRAYDTDGRDMFKNKGYSEVRMFTFGDECKPVTQIEARAEKYYEAEITWQPGFNQSAFNVRYRKANDSDAEWFEEESYLDHVKITDLQELTEYEYQVMAYCGTYESDYSAIKTFKTPQPEVSNFECGASDDESSISNHDPLAALYKGDYIWSGNFMFKIIEANGSNGNFSGKAYAMVPYLSYVKLVAEFKNIKVNTDNQVYEGEITSVYNPDSPFLLDIGGDDQDDGTSDDAGDGDGASTDDNDEISDTTLVTDIDSVYVDGDHIIIVTEEGNDTITTEEDIVITDEDGDTWTVEDGEVIVGGGTGTGSGGDTGTGGDGETTEDSAVEDDYEITIKVDFKDYNKQSYGYDELTYDVHKPMYQRREIYGEQQYIPWKSIASAGMDQIMVEFTNYDTIVTPDVVKFRTGTGMNLTATKFEGQDSIRLLNLTGKTDEEVEEIVAYVTYKDTSDTEQEKVVGGLNTISYDQQNINLVIVPVNGEAGFSAADFTNKLNDIYKQSVVNWNVTLDNVFYIDQEEWDKDEDGKMDDGESTFLSNYSDEQKKFRRKYKQARDIDKNAYYVFLLNNIPSKSGLAGYMPLKEQYAFIHSANSSNAAQLIAHELGHGAFRLWHTFSSESNYIMSEGSSDNLMDYNNGERLHKYQWDFIHNPEGGFYMFQDEEEGAFRRNACRKYFGYEFSKLQKRSVLIQGKSYMVPEPTSEKCDEYKTPIEYWLSVDDKAISTNANELYDDYGNITYKNAWIEVNSPYTGKGLTITGRGAAWEYLGINSNTIFNQEIGNSSTYEEAANNWKNKNYPGSTQADWTRSDHLESLGKAILKEGELNFEKIHGINENTLYYIKYDTENQKIYYNTEELMYFYWGYVANRNFNFSMPDEAAAFACAYLDKETFGYPVVSEFEIAPWNMKALRDGWTFSMEHKRWPETANKDIDMYNSYKISVDYLPEGVSFTDAVELVLWVAPGTVAARKITFRMSSKMLIAAYIDWQLQIFISMIDGYTFEEAVALVNYQDVLWSGITAPLSDFRTKAGFACVRAAVNEIEQNKEVSFNTLFACLSEILQEGIIHGLFTAENSPYNIALANVFKGKTRSQMLKRLDDIGLTQEEAYEFLDMLPAILTSKLIDDE